MNKTFYRYRNISMKFAEKKDIFFLFNLFNDNKVRKNALKNKIVTLNQHKEWFFKRLKKRPSIMIFKYKKVYFGQVRFDKKEKNIFEIDYSILDEFRGRGLSKKILLVALSHAPKGRYVARVKRYNVISKKVFKRLDFNLIKKNKNHLVFYLDK